MSAQTTAVPVTRGWSMTPSRWFIAHLLTLAAVFGLLVLAGRGQYFYYDEWDFLAARNEWNLLAPHVGHLSFFPQLLTTLTKFVFGLHSYWPFLLPTIAVHLVIVHLLWRVMLRSGVPPLLALLGSLLFGVLAPGTENTLWAFQIGFLTPFALGLGALLIAMRPRLDRAGLVWITTMLMIALGFSGTALPMAGAVILLLLVRHRWRSAIAPFAAVALVYGAWYLLFVMTGSRPWEDFRADSPWEIVIGIPQYIAHGFVDSVGKFLPLAELAPVLLMLLAAWVVLDLRRTGLRGVGVQRYLLLALFAFATLTAFSRVGLGNDSASDGRYAYVYGLLLAVPAALAVTSLVGAGRKATGAAAIILIVLIGYNAGAVGLSGQTQASTEQTVPRAMSAALSITDCADSSLADARPAIIVAPTLTMADVCDFVERGQFEPVAFTDADLLDAEVNLGASVSVVDDAQPEGECRQPVDGRLAIDPKTELVWSPRRGLIAVEGASDGLRTRYAGIELEAGLNRIYGLDDDLDLTLLPADGRDVCAVVQ